MRRAAGQARLLRGVLGGAVGMQGVERGGRQADERVGGRVGGAVTGAVGMQPCRLGIIIRSGGSNVAPVTPLGRIFVSFER
eukprot:533428-Pleurochrysis_carterae.AAC.2